MTEEPENMRFAYISEQDMVNSFVNQTIVTIKLPKDVQMELPPGETIRTKVSYNYENSYRVNFCFHITRDTNAS